MSNDKREATIRERAYAIWEREGRPDGRSLAHWLKAEAEIGSAKELPAATRASGGGAQEAETILRVGC